MELKGNIRVFVRVRPPLSGESAVLPFEFVDSGVGTSISGEPDCHAIEVTEPQVPQTTTLYFHMSMVD
jgi:hypothetical protein